MTIFCYFPINDSRYLGRLDNVFVLQDEFENNLQKCRYSQNYSKQIFFTGLIQVDENLSSSDENEFWENENIKIRRNY